MHLRISNFRHRYLHAVSTSPLHNTYTLRSCASYSAQARNLLSIPHLLPPRVLRFCSRYRPVIPYQTWLSRQDNEHRCLVSSLSPYPPAPFPGSLCSFAYATLAAFGPQVEREQIRYPLTSTGEFEVLIAVNPTVVCSRARLTRVISALQGSCRAVHTGVFSLCSEKRDY